MVGNVKKPFWLSLPPLVMIGAAIIMVPIMVFWTAQNIQKQKEQMVMLLKEKGAALIRSFEAGTRTGMMGMMGMPGGDFQLQKLLMETVRLPDIIHLIVTDENGTILAHNDPAQIGRSYGIEPDLKKLVEADQINWRTIVGPNRTPVFEVYKRFIPSQTPARRLGRRLPFESMRRRLSLSGIEGADAGRVIFVGLDMESLEAARKQEIQHTLVMGLILLLIGVGGIFTLFLAQAFQSTQASLRRIQAFSDRLVEELPIGLTALDGTRKIIAFNRAAEKILKIPAREAFGKQPRDLLPQAFEEFMQAPRVRPGPVTQERECLLKTGQTLFLEITALALSAEEGGSAGQVLLFRDLSEIQSLKRELETSRRLAALGHLAAGVAHEIRNPLSSIKGFATFFKERYRQNPEDQSTAEIMIQEVDRLNRVITQLLEFARPSEINRKPVDLADLMRHSLKMIATEARAKGIAVRTNLTPTGPMALDADRINQMLLNLYLNALAAMEKGGTLSVVLKPDQAAGKVSLEIRDTGRGIQKEEMEHIFDPYFTTRASGTGLGLAIVHKIIEAHQGEIRVQSEPGKGSVFTVFLPN
ncbi:MAG: PAS domain-containing protein [Desulfobacteraceae bacterium]|nr:MAG: PAS domain-containing protein [Desulfobacteraceae bacterium]